MDTASVEFYKLFVMGRCDDSKAFCYNDTAAAGCSDYFKSNSRSQMDTNPCSHPFSQSPIHLQYRWQSLPLFFCMTTTTRYLV